MSTFPKNIFKKCLPLLPNGCLNPNHYNTCQMFFCLVLYLVVVFLSWNMQFGFSTMPESAKFIVAMHRLFLYVDEYNCFQVNLFGAEQFLSL
jgi:hypothetical protein